MAFNFENLNNDTREKMLSEIQHDISYNQLYLSKRFNAKGNLHYQEILIKHVKAGNEISLGEELRQTDCFNTTEQTRTGTKKVPVNAHETLSESEFNRFYVRALCLIAIADQRKLQIYRAKSVQVSRSASQQKIGSSVDPNQLLRDLRTNIGVDTALGLPAGPNSGLSVKLI
ncbi:hypothetical protein KWF73_00365 [Acinetobacter pittii]|uniref:hypothetical protein n=1 Tax=Acinetobacter TaxID=469 RepID=UPI000A3395D9|nr:MULTISPECIES: hypothetical protein [Acinetobacter]MCG5266260.1 hypothetical protein [Acinetobacter pittii]MDS7958894.1 hypothetical protein [Acinetobacter sp. V104_13]MDS7983023.1 hypothetical protein [Acinetobacter sp. V104_3]OTS54404.1 hypothetical protein CAT00_07450 [Acinetobacter pittii]